MTVNRRLAVTMLVAWLSAPCPSSSLAAQTQASAPVSAAASTSAPTSASAGALTDGVVESVDAGSGIVTLRHGEIANMQMPAMTMTFGVARKAMLDPIKVGDRVRFRVEMLANAPTITRIEKAPEGSTGPDARR